MRGNPLAFLRKDMISWELSGGGSAKNIIPNELGRLP